VRHGDRDAEARLQREGWLEADGQVVEVSKYRELYQQIGRTWTGRDVGESLFAMPRLHDSTQPTISSDNPYGVLGPGDVLTAGRRPVTSRRSPLSYWIFAGTPANGGGQHR
jgi:microcystin-dependent protein